MEETIQALGIFNAIPDARTMLVVCPASSKLNWKREAERYIVAKNGARPRIGIAESSYWPRECDIIIINFEALGRNSVAGGKMFRREIREHEPLSHETTRSDDAAKTKIYLHLNAEG